MSSNTKKLILLTLIILGLSFVLTGIFGVSFLGFGLLNKNISRGEGKTFPVSGNFTEIDIKSQTANIRFYESKGKSAKIVWSGNPAMRFSVNSLGRVLKVTEKYKLPWFLRLRIITDRAEIGVYLPRAGYKELKLDSDSGSITVPAGFSFVNAEIGSDTGAVEFHADVSGHIKIHTDTGRISCSGMDAEKLEIHSDTGAVGVTDVNAAENFRAETDTGKIVLTNIRSGKLSAESDTGSLTLTNVIVNGSMELETDTGSISLEHCDAGKLEIESDTGSVNGTLLTDKNFIVKSGTGRIDVPQSDSGGECRIKTDTGSISIRIRGN